MKSQTKKSQTYNLDIIALTGLMGSGKSSVGRTMARLLKRKFIDTDYVIEKQEGQSIKEIFKNKGEAYFRDLEKKILKEVTKEKNTVISLGGGTIVDDENRDLVKSKGTLISLLADPEDLVERVNRRKNRPLVNNAEDPLQVLKDLWEERKDAYMDTHIKYDTENQEIDDVAGDLIDTLGLKKIVNHSLSININREFTKYKIVFKRLSQINFSELNLGHRVLLVSQKPIADKYLDLVKTQLSKQFKVHTLIIDDGEEAKNFFTYQLILQKCLALKLERKDTLVALGGGVVGDITGFAASTYLRGVNYIQIPTTLLSMIDSSVGGKTGINTPEGKNLIGSFYQPKMVCIDTDMLSTLPEREYRSGLGEMVKYALLGSKWDSLLGESFFSFISRNANKILKKDTEILRDAIDHCLKIKANIVSQDEKEKGIRAHLNLGHTFGHAIEEATNYKLLSHGEAVAIGTVCACYLSQELGILPEAEVQRTIDLMNALGLQYKIPSEVAVDDMIKAFQHDKKVEEGKVRFVLPESKLGRVDIVKDVDSKLVRKAIEMNY